MLRWLRVDQRSRPLPEPFMTIFQPATPYSNSIERPACSKCGTQMMLARIEPDKPDHDKRTFECPSCNHIEFEVVKYK
jgi:hypothetical protein